MQIKIKTKAMRNIIRPHIFKDDYWIGTAFGMGLGFFGWEILKKGAAAEFLSKTLYWVAGVSPNEAVLFAIGATLLVTGAILLFAVIATLAKKAVFSEAGFARGKTSIPYSSITKLDFGSVASHFMERAIPWDAPILHFTDDNGVSQKIDLPVGQSYLPKLAALLKERNSKIKIVLPKSAVMRRLIFWSSGTGTIVNMLLLISASALIYKFLKSVLGIPDGFSLANNASFVSAFVIATIMLIILIFKYQSRRGR
jgi:hypothetical protein